MASLRRWLPGSKPAPVEPGAAGDPAESAPPAQQPGQQPATESIADSVAEAEEILARGRAAEAVDLLAAATEADRSVATEVPLVNLRHRAALVAAEGTGREPWPPVYADPFPDVVGHPPEIDRAELTAETVGGAIAHHGCLLVHGLLDATQVDRTRDVINRSHAGAAELAESGRTGRWYSPLAGDHGDEVRMQRPWVAARGGTWLGDSPAGMVEVLGALRASGVVDAIAGHFGERASISLQKSTLRRTPPGYKLVSWHQDGDFLDADVRSVNVWVALDETGSGRRPGLEVLPRRVDVVLPAEGQIVPHSLDFGLVDELAVDTPTVLVDVQPGDALLFDERFVHRTHLTPEMTEDRLALECWFFAPSHHTSNYVPLLV